MSTNEDLCLGDKAKGCEIEEVVRLLSGTSARQAVVDKWPVLAAQLKTGCDTRNSIKTGKYVMEEILQILFAEWVCRQTDNAKLMSLIGILELEAVNLNDLARILRRRYFPYTLATESPMEENDGLSEDEKQPLKKASDDCRVVLEAENSAIGDSSVPTPSTENSKINKEIIFAVFIVIVLITLICTDSLSIFLRYKKQKLQQQISMNFTMTDQNITVTVNNYKNLVSDLSKVSVNSKVFLVVDLRNSTGWPNNTVFEIPNADSVVQVEFVGIRFSNSKIVRSILSKTGFIRALYFDDFPNWDEIINGRYKYMRKIVINKVKCNSDDTKYHVYTLSDKFNSTFHYLEEFNVTCGCLTFGKRYQIFDCVNLKKLYLSCILYGGTSYYDLGINNKLPNAQEIEIDNLKFSACPITSRLEGVKEEKNVRNKVKAIHIKICSNCILDSDRFDYCI